jgi:uncharacterized protein (TIGR02271 family)
MQMTDEQEVAAIPLVEERATVSKREVETGRLRVQVSVEEREETVPIDLLHHEVEIERVPVNRPVSELPSVRLEGSTTIIPVVEEVVVLERRLVVVEEIHVRRKATTERREIPVSLKSEHANIQTSGNLRVGSEDGSEAGLRAVP